jgi:small subunit ribosomal protein S16
MLVIRLQRTGRSGHAMFRVVVQDSRRSPTSGKVVAWVGNYDPHSKQVTVDKDKIKFYIEHGAQPSNRVAILLKNEGVKLPEWVKIVKKTKADVRNPEKRRSTRPEEAAAPVTEAEPAPETEVVETSEAETAVETEVVAEEAPEKEPEAETTTAEPDLSPAEVAEVPAEASEPEDTVQTEPKEEPAEDSKAKKEKNTVKS